MTSLKIGMLTACYHPRVNGVTRMVSLMKARMEQLGHEVIVFSFHGLRGNGHEPGVIWTRGIPLGEGYFWSFALSRRTQRFMRRMDVLHCHHVGMVLDLGKRYFEGPVVYTNHTRYDLYSEVYLRMPGRLTRRLASQAWSRSVNGADMVIAPSKSIRRLLLGIGVHRPIRVIPNGVVTDHFLRPYAPLRKSDLGFEDQDVLCVFVGRLSQEKNLDGLLEAFARARRTAPALRLLLVGDGRQRQHLEQLALELGLGRAVRFYGETPFEVVPNILAASDLFVSASQSEVHPLTAIEAMAAGLPVIAPLAPGFMEMVDDGRSGILADSPQSLVQGLAALGQDAKLRHSMGTAGRLLSQAYDIERTVEQTLDLYRQVVTSRTRT